MLDRSPPCNLEAEQSVLGAVLLRAQVLDQVADLLTPDDFYRSGHGHIFQAMLDLWGRGEPVDLVTVTALLKERGKLDDVGGPVFLADLSEHVGTAVNAPYYSKLVWEKSQIRKVKTKAQQILSESENSNGNLADFLTWAESQIFEVTQPALSRNSKFFSPLECIENPVSTYLRAPPPDRDYVFKSIQPSGIVAALIAMGGTGKGYLIFLYGLSLATGIKIGPLEPAKKFKVLYIAGEDSHEELWRRTVSASKALWPDGLYPPDVDNFIPVSVMGKVGPLMQLDDAGNPVNAPGFDWLCKTLENLQVEVLILDPKSKFFGLVENDNNHNAAWITCLESLVARFGITVLFSHHESKARAGSMDQASSRGGGALTDGCRWVANLKTMDPKTAEKFQVADPHNYVVLDVTKSNYAAKLPAPIFFRRGEGGALNYVDLAVERAQGIADLLFDLLANEAAQGRYFSRRDLLYGKNAKSVIEGIKDAVEGFSRVRDINLAVDHLLAQGWIKEERLSGKPGAKKTILVATF